MSGLLSSGWISESALPYLQYLQKLTGKRVLIVDDEAQIRELLVELLSEVGVVSESASNGHEGLQLAQDHHFDLILSDIKMPRGDGITFLSALRQGRTRFPPVILMSGYSELDEAKALEMGAFAMLTKPFRPEHLFSLVSRALACECLAELNPMRSETVLSVSPPS